MVGDSVRFMALAAKNKETAMCGKGGRGINENLHLDFFFLFFFSKYRHAPNKHKNPIPNADH